MAEPVTSKAKKLPWSTKLIYGVGTIAFGIKDHGFNALLMIYYNQVLGLPAAWVGAAIMLAMVVDAILDPVVGQWSDNFRSKWGRRHPFMYASVIPVAIFYMLLWFPPAGASHVMLFAYLLVMTSITRTFIGIYEIPSTALLAEFTQDYHERTELVSYRYFFGVAGGIAMGIFVFSTIFSDDAASTGGLLDQTGYHTYAWIAAPLMAIAIFISSIGTHNRISSLLTPPRPERKSLLQTLKEMAGTLFHRVNAPIFIGSIFGSMGGGLYAALTIYMQTYFWQLNGDQIAVLTSSGLLGVILALVIALPLSKVFGKKWTTLALFSVTLLGIVAPVALRLSGFFPANGAANLLPLLFAFQAFVSMSVVAASILTASMIADATDQIQLTTGRQSEGLLFSAATFIGKTVSGMGVLMSGLMLTLVGFPDDAKPGAVAQSTVDNLALALTIATFIFTTTALIFMSFYPVSRSDHESAVETLAQRRAGPL
ncbi:MFS transporter [Hyphomonas sp. WL0036]|uniref:MFS transporter n=1 Tax=Hyphomonas sediminis TaxID=2866160 RepID=UPI001C7EA4EE|nr:MFS transporter [Hyphomonas sediminis]MBY9067178.1 MFS transporter [Hyphomonas sediminis]